MGLFGKKKETNTETKPEQKPEQQPEQKKVKPLSEREIIQKRYDEAVSRVTAELEQLPPGQALIYKLPELYWVGFTAFIIAEVNPEYPQKGKKYLMTLDNIVDGKPAGKKRRYFEANIAKEYAESVVTRTGERFI
jgi:hypothetical protein